jgi:hypothetical protein
MQNGRITGKPNHSTLQMQNSEPSLERMPLRRDLPPPGSDMGLLYHLRASRLKAIDPVDSGDEE